MGTVFLAEREDGSRVAVKVVHSHLLASRSFYDRFLREAELGKRVQHHNVVRTLDVEMAEEDGEKAHFLVMEYVEGQTLRALLEELGQVPEELCRHIGLEIARALEAIHAAGVIHRDLKPENVLITKDHVVKVMDLGVARLMDEVIRLSQTGAFAGSVLYAAPEQFMGGEPDPRADLYALGLLLYELVAGRHPSSGEDFAQTMQRRLNERVRPASDINPQISSFFDELLSTLLSRDKEGRFAGASEVVAVLEEAEESSWWKERAQAARARAARPRRRLQLQRETGVHGRDEELSRLLGAFEHAQAKQGRVLLVEGEAGIGKTRVVDEFVDRLRHEDEELHFLFASFPPGGAATAASAFATAFCEHFGREALDEALPRYLKQTPILVPAFTALLRGEPAPPGHEPLTRDSIQTVFVHAMRALAAERPTVLFIDDLQFAPEEGLALFAGLAAVAAEHRVLLIGGTRPGLPDDWIADLDRLVHSSRITLGRLGPKSLARVLIDAFGSERLAQELGLQIAQKSDGNPFFVFEIIRGLREGNFIARQEDGTWVKTQAIEQITIPSSVLDLIQARISDLVEEEKDLVDVASCCGFEFDPLLVAAALGMEQIPAMKRFARIEKRHRLIRSSGRTCVFDHHQIQEALYNGMPELLREPYHAAIGDALEKRESAHRADAAGLAGALCVDLCSHLLKGGQGDRAKRYLLPALDHLEGGYRNEAVVELADRALGKDGLLRGSERVEVLLRKADRLELLGEREQELETLDEAQRLSEQAGDPTLQAQVRLQYGTHLMHVAEYPRAQEYLEQARRLAGDANDLKLESAAEAALGSIWHQLGIYARAREHHERTLELAGGLGDPEEESRAHANLGAVLSELGHVQNARAHLDRLLALTQETGSRRWEALAHCNLGRLDLQVGEYKDARRNLERSLVVAHEIGARRGVATAIGNLGVVFRSLGKLTDALQHFDRHLALARELGNRLDEAAALHGAGALYVELGEPTLARAKLEEALAVSREIGVRRAEGFTVHGLARLAEMKGDLAQAARYYDEAQVLLREIGNRRDEAEALLDVARIRMLRGQPDVARTLFGDALAIARERSYATGIVASSAYLALLDSEVTKQAVGAMEEFGERVEHMARMRASFVLWRVTHDRAYLVSSHQLLAHLFRYAPKELKHSMVSKVPWHREILEAARKEEV